MLLFDIGVVLCVMGLFNLPYITLSPKFKKTDKNALFAGKVLMYLLIVVGVALMIISHYVVEGHQSILP